jgi:hypothetical protein
LEAAIRRLVEFLDQEQGSSSSSSTSSDEVVVITGTGRHSGADGPVLKGAVEKYLQSHAFQFTYSTGSFRIAAKSGCQVYRKQSSCEDTKVILAGEQEFPVLLKKKHMILGNGNKNHPHPMDDVLLDDGPCLADVARDEAELQRGKEESLEAYRLRLKEINQETREYRRAISVSELDYQQDCENQQNEEKEQLQRAISLSEQEEASAREEEDAIIQKVLALSEQEASEKETEDEIMLKQALALSEREIFMTAPSDDEALQHALELSKTTLATDTEDDDDDEVLRRVLELSTQETASEEELLQEAIAASQHVVTSGNAK